MSHWLQMRTEYASQRSYLEDLFQVYPKLPEGIRDINKNIWADVEKHFEKKKKDNDALIKELLKLNLLPIKDSYIAYWKRDETAINRKPRTLYLWKAL